MWSMNLAPILTMGFLLPLIFLATSAKTHHGETPSTANLRVPVNAVEIWTKAAVSRRSKEGRHHWCLKRQGDISALWLTGLITKPAGMLVDSTIKNQKCVDYRPLSWTSTWCEWCYCHLPLAPLLPAKEEDTDANNQRCAHLKGSLTLPSLKGYGPIINISAS